MFGRGRSVTGAITTVLAAISDMTSGVRAWAANPTAALLLAAMGALQATGTAGKLVFSQDPSIAFAAGAVNDIVIYDGTKMVLLPQQRYGDGTDGAISISSGTTTLTRDYQWTNCTLSGTGVLNLDVCAITANGTLDINAAAAASILYKTWNANSAAVNVAGAALVSYSAFQTSLASAGGGVGQTGSTNGGAAVANINSVAAAGGGNPGAPGTAGTGLLGANAAGVAAGVTILGKPAQGRFANGTTLTGGIGSGAGSSGGGDGTATASGAGAGGAFGGYGGAIFAKRISRSSSNSNAGVFVCLGGNGGNGGTPAAGNRGGGCPSGGGGGGALGFVADEYLGTVHTNCCNVAGGAGGNAGTGTGTGTSGTGAQAGYGGQVHVRMPATGVCTVTDNRAVGGTLGSGTTGGAATNAYANL